MALYALATLEPYNFTSKTLQQFVFMYFDQKRQRQCTYQFLKLVWDKTKLKLTLNSSVFFNY